MRNSKSTILTIQNAYRNDVGRCVARIDYDLIDILGIKLSDVGDNCKVWIGDRIEISSPDGKFSTYAACVPLYPSDEGKSIIRLDRQTRNNIGKSIKIGQKVKIRKVDFFSAREVTIELRDSVSQKLDNACLQIEMNGLTAKEGDVISLPHNGSKIAAKISKIIPRTKGKPAVMSSNTQFTIITEDGK